MADILLFLIWDNDQNIDLWEGAGAGGFKHSNIRSRQMQGILVAILFQMYTRTCIVISKKTQASCLSLKAAHWSAGPSHWL